MLNNLILASTIYRLEERFLKRDKFMVGMRALRRKNVWFCRYKFCAEKGSTSHVCGTDVEL
jgi:hypothetical protein